MINLSYFLAKKTLLDYSGLVGGLWETAHLKSVGNEVDFSKKLSRIERSVVRLERNLNGIESVKVYFNNYEFDFSRANRILDTLKRGAIPSSNEFERFSDEILQVQRQVTREPNYSFA